jgi:hypothetical protein
MFLVSVVAAASGRLDPDRRMDALSDLSLWMPSGVQEVGFEEQPRLD